MAFIRFMSSTTGRWARGVIGAALVVLAFVLGGAWLWLIAPGIFFIAVGAADVCVLAPMFKMPFAGHKVRTAIKE